MSHYIIYSILSLGICFASYHLFLKREKCFGFNRFYLIGTLLLCVIAPILEFSAPHSMPKLPEIGFETFGNRVIEDNLIATKTVEILDYKFPLFLKFLISIYVIVTLLMFFRFGKHLSHLLKVINKVQFRTDGLQVIFVQEEKNSFSFFNYLFIHQKDFENNEYSETIVKHEHTHSKQLHSIDIIIIELMTCFFWFNPFLWLYKIAIVQNHEFIADNSVVKSGFDVKRYSKIIIQSGNKQSYSRLLSGFNFIQTKNRLIMLNQSKSSIMKQSIKIITALTLFVAVFTFSSFTDNKRQLVVVIDAGHGGKDSGNLQEKEIVLQISNALASYSNQKIRIITTRTPDEFLSLKDRTNFINREKPDLLISLHCNATKESSTNGVEAFYYEKNDFKDESHEYSKTVVQGQIDLFNDRGAIKTAGFYLLKNSECPAISLELGFITNEKDKAVLTDVFHQQTIAKSLYESLLKIRDAKFN